MANGTASATVPPMSSSRDFQALGERLEALATRNGWEKFHTPANLSRALAVEVGELNELFLWDGHPRSHPELNDEIADCLLYLLRLAQVTGVDPLAAAHAKMDVNERRVWNADGRRDKTK
jgi:NTP pyrophosphatase (non-canonical NTP hydrolase)